MYNLTQPIVVGVIVFALSQYFLKLILEPIIQFRKLLSVRNKGSSLLLTLINFEQGSTIDLTPFFEG